jgi:signal transduction histidine kinase
MIQDGAIAAVLAVMAQVQLPLSESFAVRLLVLAATAPVAWRRRAPLLVCAVIAVAVAAMQLTADQPAVLGEYFAVMLAGYTVAERCTLSVAVAGGLLLVAGVVGHDWGTSEYGSVSGVIGDLVIPIVIWGLGRVVRLQRSRAARSDALLAALEAEREELAREAVARERAHLARELHDVVTHSVSVVVIQAQGAAIVLGPDHPEVGTALGVIEDSGRTALTEMRRLLGLLKDDEQALARAPQPGLAQLPALVAQVRAAGLRVRLVHQGDRGGLGPGIELTVYRIVQEALTNALRHAGPDARATVTISQTGDAVRVEVLDDGASTGPREPGGGRGLTGMAERLAVFGGRLQAGPVGDGKGFRVLATIPAGRPL